MHAIYMNIYELLLICKFAEKPDGKSKVIVCFVTDIFTPEPAIKDLRINYSKQKIFVTRRPGGSLCRPIEEYL